MTGMNPGKHGIFDFYRNDFVGQDYFRKPIDGTYVKRRDYGIFFQTLIDKSAFTAMHVLSSLQN